MNQAQISAVKTVLEKMPNEREILDILGIPFLADPNSIESHLRDISLNEVRDSMLKASLIAYGGINFLLRSPAIRENAFSGAVRGKVSHA